MSQTSKLSSSVFFEDVSLVTSIDKSISGLDDEEVLAYELVCRLNAPSIHKMRRSFKRRLFPTGPPEADSDGVEVDDPDKGVPAYKKLYLSQDGFIAAIDEIYGKCKYSFQALKLFKLLDPACSGKIWWNDLLDKLIEFGVRKNRSRSDKWTPVDAPGLTIRDLVHCRKDTILKVVSIETSKSFCYGVITSTGRVGLYSSHMKLLSEYDIFSARSGVAQRVKSTWITDAVYFEDVKCLTIVASDRSMAIYDASTLWHTPIFLITGISNIPTCLHYESSIDNRTTSSLFFGDDHGGITSVFFKQPRTSLFFKRFVDKINTYFWIELLSAEHESYCDIKISRRIHTRSVKRIFYCRHSDSIITCSNDPNASILIRHRKAIRNPYTFKLSKGVLCFHLSPSLNVLASGGSDCIVRIWDPVVPSGPAAILHGHSKPVIDVAILAHLEVVVSFARNGILKIWDLLEFDCLQSVGLHYPSFGILGKRIEFGSSCIYPGPTRKKTQKELYEAQCKSGRTSRRCSRMFVEGGASVLKMASIDLIESKRGSVDVVKFESDGEFNKWNKPDIFVVCCNHLATLPFTRQPLTEVERVQIFDCDDDDGGSDDNPSPLPPPEKLYRARKPELWKMADVEVDEKPVSESPSDTKNQDVTDSHNFLTIPTSSRERDVLASLESEEERRIRGMSLDELLNYAGLGGLLQRDFLKGTIFKHDLNARMALLQDQHDKMRLHISQGAPFMALDLYEVSEVKFTQNLPISDRMKKKSGLSSFGETDIFNKYPSCFSMASPRSSYTLSTSRTEKSRNTANSLTSQNDKSISKSRR